MVNLPTLPNVCRVAAHAGYLVSRRYFSRLFVECDAYTTAIVMCPDCKLHWFVQHQWPVDAIEMVRRRAIDN
ncbi:uncharacterized protein C8Q71DRAFT_281482 [Rhodofomes roseus]|uniref:Uncharacterized protein n=1 Tax=Rhodofomes roseus TaxID=34475 RepID=A0ABQ8K5P7_9APHY|nr:uncharacterized protein C8Q71DRAFT_281482 [Rhodofomes roseus]KAH9832092.1 hypothetical protein C8Q71DRAFT_281482 [Rhodofomes roseus]